MYGRANHNKSGCRVGSVYSGRCAVVVVVAFLWRIPSREDLKRVEDKSDNANRQNLKIQGDLKVLTEKVERIEGYFDIPELKSGRRASGTDE